MDHDSPLVNRKTVLRAALVAVPAALVGAPALARARTGTLEPTPMCDDGDDPTPPQMEGPYFKPNSPQRTDIVPSGAGGVRLTVSGYVFGLSCQPLGGVLLDFWQADANGAYDNTTYRFRGHQYTDAQGHFSLSTVVAGLYPGRTRHIHVKAQAPGKPILTTQLYFPGEPRNNTDPLFDPRLLMTVHDVPGGREAAFDFVLNVTGSGGPGGGTWAAGTAYAVGARATYGGREYVCLQAHTAQVGWEPPNAPALWR